MSKKTTARGQKPKNAAPAKKKAGKSAKSDSDVKQEGAAKAGRAKPLPEKAKGATARRAPAKVAKKKAEPPARKQPEKKAKPPTRQKGRKDAAAEEPVPQSERRPSKARRKKAAPEVSDVVADAGDEPRAPQAELDTSAVDERASGDGGLDAAARESVGGAGGNVNGATVAVDVGELPADETRAYLKGLVEAILFVAEAPLSIKELARAAKIDRKRVTELLDELRGEFEPRGIQIHEVAGGFCFRSNSAYAEYVRGHLAQRPVRLSRPQLETLAIIAYRQPITRPEIDDIRGVDSGPVLKGLLERDLVKILGKKDEPGRPMLYGTSGGFLTLFNMQSLQDLPTLKEFTELSEDSRQRFEKQLGEDAPDGPIDLSRFEAPPPASGDDSQFDDPEPKSEEGAADIDADVLGPAGDVEVTSEDSERDEAPAASADTEDEDDDEDWDDDEDDDGDQDDEDTRAEEDEDEDEDGYDDDARVVTPEAEDADEDDTDEDEDDDEDDTDEDDDEDEDEDD